MPIGKLLTPSPSKKQDGCAYSKVLKLSLLTFAAFDTSHVIISTTATKIAGMITVLQGILVARASHVVHCKFICKSFIRKEIGFEVAWKMSIVKLN